MPSLGIRIHILNTFFKIFGICIPNTFKKVFPPSLIKSNIGVYLVTPNEIRWNSMFDSIQFLLKQINANHVKCIRLCDELKINRFKKDDIKFMEELIFVMEPMH